MQQAVNENSLKQLNAYIESATLDRPLRATHLTFYIRSGNGNTSVPSPKIYSNLPGNVESVLK